MFSLIALDISSLPCRVAATHGNFATNDEASRFCRLEHAWKWMRYTPWMLIFIEDEDSGRRERMVWEDESGRKPS